MIKFKHFNYKSDFLNHLENGLIQNDDIVFIKDAQSIYTKETFYSEVSSKDLKSHCKKIELYCIEPVTITVNGVNTVCKANEHSIVFVGDNEFVITPTSKKSIKLLSSYPIPLTWYDWLEGVDTFSNIVFDMNSLDTYKHWSQGYQGQYHVQYAQYINCIFWSDNSYVSTLTERTNYTLYASSELPLCYSTIRENTYKAFYFAYGVTSDPNWYNEDYIYSFSLANYATQTWSYYGARSIGVFNSAVKPITLPKDCRGLIFYSPAIENVGVLNAENTTNFGAKSGSWRDAFGYCSSLKNLYIQNLKASINVSWSPINSESISYIVTNAINTSEITISVSSYTWNLLSDDIKTAASEKNIKIELLEGNYVEDKRMQLYATKEELADNYQNAVKTITVNGVDVTPTNGTANIGYINKQISISEESVMTIFPNIYYKNINTALSELTINLSGESDSNILNEYFVEFTIGTSSTVISLPSTIKWVNGETPTFEAGCTYQISIINNLGVVAKFK